MKKNILLQNVSYAANIGRANRKVIKNLSFEIKDKTNFTFIANKIEREALIKVLSNQTDDIWGKISFSGEYFKKFKNVKDAFFVLNSKNNKIKKSSQSEATILNFLKLDKKNIKDIKSDLVTEIKKKKLELKKSSAYLKTISTKKGFLRTEYLQKNKIYENFKNENNKLIKTQLEYKAQRNGFIEANKKIVKKRKNLVKLYKKNKKFIIKKHNKKVNWQRISTSTEIDRISNLYLMNKELNKNRDEKFKIREINKEKEFKNFKKALVNFQKIINNFFDEKFSANKDYLLQKELLKDSTNIHELFMSFIWINNFINKNIIYLEKSDAKKISTGLKNLFNMKNDISELTSLDFSRFIKSVSKEFASKIDYYKNVILDIEKRLKIVDIEDKKEKYHFMRKSWEFERISLRYQSQIYREKILIVKRFESEFNQCTKQIPYIYNKKVYDKYIEFLEMLLLIDVGITKWRKQRGIKSEKLYLSQQIKTQNDFFKKNKININELNKLLIDPMVFDAVDDSYVKEFKNNYYDYIKEKMLNDLNKEDSEKQEKIIIKYNKKIKSLKNDLNILLDKTKNINYNMRNYAKELITVSLGSDFKINTILSDAKDSEKNKLIILKEIMKGKKIIIIDDLEMLGSPKEASEFVNNLKEKYNILFIFFTKNIESAIEISDYIAVLYKGIVVELGNAKNFLKNEHHEYTSRILSNSQNKYISAEQNDWEIKLGNRFSGHKLKKIAPEHWIF